MQSVTLSPCGEGKFPTIPDLKFFRTDNDLFYFDAAGYLKNIQNQQPLNIDDFFSTFDFLTELIVEAHGIDREDLCVVDENGIVYLEECLAIPFLIYTERWFWAYLVARMEDLLMFGVTINDSLARHFYHARFE